MVLSQEEEHRYTQLSLISIMNSPPIVDWRLEDRGINAPSKPSNNQPTGIKFNYSLIICCNTKVCFF